MKSCLASVDREDSQVRPLLPTKVMYLDPSFWSSMRYGPSSGIVVVSRLAWASSNSCYRTLGVRMQSVEYVVASNKSKFVPLQSSLRSAILKVSARSPLQLIATTLQLSRS